MDETFKTYSPRGRHSGKYYINIHMTIKSISEGSTVILCMVKGTKKDLSTFYDVARLYNITLKVEPSGSNLILSS